MEEKTPGYSAEVAMWLECFNKRIPLTQAAPTFVIAQSPVAIPACDAQLVMLVDGHRFQNAVRLVNGMSKDVHEAAIRLDESVPPF